MRHGGWNVPLAVGFVLLVLGAANWGVSTMKIAEYGRRATGKRPSHGISLADFPELTPETNKTLLKRLNRGRIDYPFVEGKLDFYEVVETGGRFLFFAGLLLVTGGLVHSWRVRPAS